MENKGFGMGALADRIEMLGKFVISVVSAVLKFVYGITLRPIIFIIKKTGRFAKNAYLYIKRSIAEQLNGEKYFTGRFARSVKMLVYTLFHSPKNFGEMLKHYIHKGRHSYRSPIRLAVYVILPLLSLSTLLIFLNNLGNMHPALCLSIGDTVIGYVDSESEYFSAKTKAKERLNLTSESETKASLPEVTYSVKLINVNGFTSEEELCDSLIKNSDAKITNACGIYIDDRFLCAVKSETDARRIFNSFLENYRESDSDIVSFVQSISFVEGLYPDSDDVVWNSDTLQKKINMSDTENRYHTVTDGDTIETITARYGITEDKLKSLNPEYDFEGGLKTDDRLLITDEERILTVKVTKTVVSTEEVPYTTTEMQTDILYLGTTRTITAGKTGTDQVTSLVTYVDGNEVSREEISRVRTKDPVNKRVQVGTRALSESYSVTVINGGVFVWPAVNATNINSPYGYRWGKLHAAIDIGSSTGTSLGKAVVAAAAGTVTVAGVHSSYGYYVRIDHGNGLETLYAHCQAGSLMVKAGDTVYAGQQIARIGMTGYATGPHLHFEVIINGRRVNPAPYLGLK